MRIKSIKALQQEASLEGSNQLKRNLGAVQLTAIGIGVIIGAGLFSLTGIAAAAHTGPAVTLSFLIAAIGCAFSALCYAEFAAMVPVSGSAYTYAYATMGEWFAWIIGWDLVLEYAVGAATVAISWSRYLDSFLTAYGIRLPARWLHSPFEQAADGSFGWINLPALLIVLLISAVLIGGNKGSTWLNLAVVLLKVGVVLLFIILGWRHIDTANYHPYLPANTGTFGAYGWSGVFRGAGVIFFVFIGFDIVATMARETVHPQRNMPRGILGSLAICTLLFILFGYVLTGLAHYTSFSNEAAPVAVAIARTPYPWLMPAVLLAILIGYTSVILVDLMGQSRVFFAMSRDGLLPSLFSRLHPRRRTPVYTNLILAIFIGLFAGLVPIRIVGEMTSIGTLLAFIMVCGGVLVLRRKQPGLQRPFRTPWVPFVPVAGIITCLLMMCSLPTATWLRLLVWLAVGILVYLGYGRRHSRLARKHVTTADEGILFI